MARLRELLADLRERLRANERRLKRAQKRFKNRRKDAYVHHRKGLRCDAKADRLRVEGRRQAAARVEKRAQRFHRRAWKQHQKAQWWLGRIKLLQQRIHRLEIREDEIEAEIRKASGVKVRVNRNRVTGGTPKSRFRVAALLSAKRCSNGKRRNFYSQPGAWSVDRCFTGEPYGYRSDCSQWLTSVCWTAGLPDPNGTDWYSGWTGTQVGEHNGWRRATETEMRQLGWGYVVYGSGSGYHVEAYVGPGNRTIGHGSAPIDAGVIDLFGNGDYRCFVFDPK